MKFLISGSASTAYLYRSVAARVYVLNNDGSPIDLTAAGTAVVDLYQTTDITNAAGTVVAAQPIHSLRVTADPSLGVYGVGTLELPGVLLVSGSTWSGRLRLDTGGGTFGTVVGSTLLSGGSGFKTKPTVTVDGQGVGSGAVVTISMVRTALPTPTVTSPGSGYSSLAPPTVTLTGGNPYIPAALTAVVAGPITSTVITNPGSYASAPTVTAANGTGAVLTANMMTPINTIAIAAGGTGYVSGTFGITSHNIINGTVTVTGGVVTAVNFAYANPSSPSLSGTPLNWVGKSTSGSGAAFTYTYLAQAPLGYLTTSTSIGANNCEDAFGTTVTLNRTVDSALGGSNTISSILFYKSGGSLALQVQFPAATYTTVTNQDVIFTGGPFGAGVTVRFNGGGGSTPPTASIFAGAANFTYPIITTTSGIYTLQVRKTGVGFTMDGYSNTGSSTTWAQTSIYNAYYEIIEGGQNLTSVPGTWYWIASGQPAGGVTTGMVIRYASVDTVTAVGGTGYKSNSALTFTGGSPAVAATGSVSAINGGVTGFIMDYAGLGYDSAPTISFSTGTATAVAALNTSIESVAVSAPGSLYAKQPLAVLSGGTPTTPASILLQLGAGSVTYSLNRVSVEIE
jgi:hypothetical protein